MQLKTKFICTLFIIFAFYSCKIQSDRNTKLYQYATINALMESGYDGDLTLKELQKKGSFGIGTFNELDGEMIGFNNHFYQIKSDGKVYPVKKEQQTPFAVVTDFKSDKEYVSSKDLNLKNLYSLLDSLTPNKNLFFAYQIKAQLNTLKTRSVPKQNKPYPVMIDAVKTQSVFELGKIKGTLVGFRFPEYMKGLNVPGYHFHFISEDQISGGHVLDLAGANFEISVDSITDFELKIPNNPEFNKLNLSKTKLEDLEKVEK